MQPAYWCILIAGVLPVATIAVAKWGRRDYDNKAPREWLEAQSGLRRRADYAHRNHFEAFPFFAAAVLAAQQMHAPVKAVDQLALLFIAARLVYTWCYLTNRATLRSIAWLVGYATIITLFFLAGVQ